MAYTPKTYANGDPFAPADATRIEAGVKATADVADAAETPAGAQAKATAAQTAASVAAATDATSKAGAAQTAATTSAAADATTKVNVERDRALAVEAIKADLVGGKVPTAQIAAISTHETVSVATEAARLALTTSQVQPGDEAIVTGGTSAQKGRWLLLAADPSQTNSWLRLSAPGGVQSVNGQTVPDIVLAPADVGAAAAGDPRIVNASPDLPSVDVAGAAPQLASGVRSRVASGSVSTSPALAASVGTPPLRYAVKAPGSGAVTHVFPDASGTSQTVTVLAGEVLTLRQGSVIGWEAESGNKPAKELDSRYGRPNIAGARQLSASNVGSIIGYSVQPPQNAATDHTWHRAQAGGTDWRLQYGAPLAAEKDGATNPVLVKADFCYPLLRVDTVATTSGSPSISDPSITVEDQGRPITGAGIPAGSYVGTVSGVNIGTFLLSSSGSSQVNVNATATASGVSATLAELCTPVTFAGRRTTQFDPGATAPPSDPIPVDVPAGAVFMLRTYRYTLFGTYRTNTTATAVGDTSIVLSAAPAVLFLNALPQSITVASEQVTATAWNASTLTLTVTALAAAHAVGAVIGQQTITNSTQYGDQGAGQVFSDATGAPLTTIAALSGGASTTLAAAVAAGDKTIKLTAPLNGLTLVLDTSGSGVQETVTLGNVVGESSPYTAYLAGGASVANAHASGVAVTTTVTSAFCLVPTSITADRPLSTPLPAVFLGPVDSIGNGVGYNTRGGQSYLKDALDQAGRVYLDASLSGEPLYAWAAVAFSRRRRSLMTLCGWGYIEEATNDWGAGRTLADVQANALKAVGYAHSRGLKVAIQTSLPRTSSIDYATVAGQTVSANEPVRLAYNAWLMAGSSGADLAIPAHQAVDSGLVAGAAETGKWLAADANLGPYTISGLHPSYLGHRTLTAWLIAGGWIGKMN